MGSRDICVGHFCHPVLCVTVGVWLTPYAVKIGLHMSALKVMSFSWRIFTFPFRIFIEPCCSNNWTVSRKYSKFWRRSKMKHLIKINLFYSNQTPEKLSEDIGRYLIDLFSNWRNFLHQKFHQKFKISKQLNWGKQEKVWKKIRHHLDSTSWKRGNHDQ